MITLRKEFFGGLICDSLSGKIVQLNKPAFNILERFLQNKNLEKDELQFITSGVFNGINLLSNERRVIKSDKLNRHYLSAPESVVIRLTTECNLNCEGCYQRKGKYIMFDFEKLKKLLDDISAMGVFRIQLGGGEPIMYEKLLEVIEYAQKKALFVSVGTNGTLLSDSYIRKMKDFGVGHVQLSLTNPGIDDELWFEKMLNLGLKLRSAGIQYGYNLIITRYNFNKLDKLIQFAQKSKPNKIKLLRVKYSNENRCWYNKESINVSDNVLKTVFKKILNKYSNIELDCSYSMVNDDKYKLGCIAGNRTIIILPNGDAGGCPFLLENNNYCDNIYKYKNIQSFWENSTCLTKMRKILSTKEGEINKLGLRKDRSTCILFYDKKVID